MKQRYLANNNVAPLGLTTYYAKLSEDWATDPFYPRFWPDKVTQPDRKRKPSGIFTCDMSDLFGDWIPFAWQNQIFTVIRRNSQHRFYLLTKQPQNLIKWSPFPDNCWVGVTATNAKMAEEAGFWLWEVKAKVKFISFEPLLERIPVHFADYIGEGIEGINWIIIGAQTKPYKPPKIEWVEEIVEAADKAGIPVFQKDNLKPLLGNNLRQELPK